MKLPADPFPNQPSLFAELDAADGVDGKMLEQFVTLNLRVHELEAKIDHLRDLLLAQRAAKDSYSTKEVADLLGRKTYTVREWARLRRINAYKTMSGRGGEEEWRIGHDELVRIQNEGLLPVPDRY